MHDRERWRFTAGLPDTIAMAELHMARPFWDYDDLRWGYILAGHLSRIPTVAAAKLLQGLVLRMQAEARLN